MKLKGRVAKITYENKKDNFIIFKLYVEDTNSLPEGMIDPKYPHSVSVTGNLVGEIREEYILEVEGDWEYKESQKTKGFHPWSFKATAMSVKFESPEQIAVFLTTLTGVGEVTAKKIAFKFRDQTFEILEKRPLKLTEVGVSPDKCELIHQEYMMTVQYSALSDMLSPYGLGHSHITKIQRQYKEKAVEMVKDNPYIIVNDNIAPFKMIDIMAADLEFTATDERRVQSGIVYTMASVLASKGHCYSSLDVLTTMSEKMFKSKNSAIQGNVSYSFIRSEINLMVESGMLTDDDGRIYETYRYKHEVEVAKRLAKRLKCKSPYADVSDEVINECIEKAQQTLNIKLADKQREAVIAGIKNMTLVITGGPGTGKTTTLKAMLLSMEYVSHKCNIPEREVILSAPTGKAAQRMKEATGQQAATIHRMLQYVPYSDGNVECKDENNPIEGDVLVVDESSMIDIDLFATLIRAIKDETALILLGDKDQLPSVGPGNVLHDLLECPAIPHVKLEVTYRQGEQSPILLNARKINEGDNDLVFERGSDCEFIEIPDEADTEDGEHVVKAVAQVYFEQFMRYGGDVDSIQVLCPMRKQSARVKTQAVVNNLNEILQETINGCVLKENQMTYGKTQFRRGDKVMQLVNNYDKNVFNGDVGIVVECSEKNSKLMVDFLGERVEYKQNELDELQHSFATTIHKSQGSEYPVVIIPMSKQYKTMLQRNLIFTALTRAKKKAYFIGDRQALTDAIDNVSIRQRNSYLVERICEEVKK